jgi:hypothetical protein
MEPIRYTDDPNAPGAANGEVPPRVMPNRALLAAIATIEELQKDMHPKEGRNAEEYVREARAGAIYDSDATQ